MAGTPSGTVILRVATTGDVLPVIAGLEPLASAMSGGTRVTLFAITEPGLFQLTVAGSGAYDLELGIAGDVTADGKVVGAAGAAVAVSLAGSDRSDGGLLVPAARGAAGEPVGAIWS